MVEERIGSADCVIFVDFPLWRHYWWVVKRQWQSRIAQRSELPCDCPEFSLAYTTKLASIMWQVHTQYLPWFRRLVAEKSRTGQVIHLRSPNQWRQFSASLSDGNRSEA